MSNATLDLISRHGSVRKYRPDPVPVETIEAIVAAAQRTSTSSNMQAYSVVAVTDAANAPGWPSCAATRSTSPRRRSSWPGAPTWPGWTAPASCAATPR